MKRHRPGGLRQFTGHARYDVTEGTGEAKKFDFDYFLKDHLGNVRMVLTDELDTAQYAPLTFEDANVATQNAIWENRTGGSIKVGSSRIARPGAFGTSGTNGSYAMLVRKSTGAIGAAKLLKVMAGDRIHTQVDYFYTAANTNNTGSSGINSLITNLATTLVASGQVSGVLKDGASTLTSALSGNTGLVNWLNTPNNTSGANNAPKAYLNILFFDEQFRPDNTRTVVIPVAYSPNAKGTISRMFANAVSAGQNGYVYIYFSNESDEMVYFDNFMLTHELGSLREETHYYPFGLTMAGISSRAIGKLENKFKYNKGSELQSNEFSDGSGLEMYDTKFRGLDPQIGRWWQIDPKPDYAQSLYSSMSNNPILYNDPFGDTLRGIDNQDARRTQKIIRQTFQGSEMRHLRRLFKRDGNTFQSISEKDFAKATANLSTDQKALAKGYKDVINATQVHTVEVLNENERLSLQTLLSVGPITVAELDKTWGGGVNRGVGNGSHTAIVMQSTHILKDYVDEAGRIVPRAESAGELLAHEVVGHALGRQSKSPTYKHADAIQAGNLYLRVSGNSNVYREGSTHGAFLFKSDAEAVPAYLQTQ